MGVVTVFLAGIVSGSGIQNTLFLSSLIGSLFLYNPESVKTTKKSTRNKRKNLSESNFQSAKKSSVQDITVDALDALEHTPSEIDAMDNLQKPNN